MVRRRQWTGFEPEAVLRPEQTGAKLFELGSDRPYRHRAAWAKEESSTGSRLKIGGGEAPFALFRALSTALAEPLYILVVLLATSTGESGRYESIEKTHAEVTAFLDEFETFFSTDPRVEVWVGQTDGDALLVHDKHDLIFAYGPLGRFKHLLAEQGVPRGRTTVPFPHVHPYDPRNREDELRLVRHGWNRVLPLEDGDHA
jgi:hypothetical protein